MAKRKEGKKENMIVLSVKVPPDLKDTLRRLAEATKADERDMSFWARKFIKLGLEVYNSQQQQKGGKTVANLIAKIPPAPANLAVAGKRR